MKFYHRIIDDVPLTSRDQCDSRDDEMKHGFDRSRVKMQIQHT